MLAQNTRQATALAVAAFCLALSPLSSPARAADFTDFYPLAEDTILHPPKLDSLQVLCGKEVAKEAHYSFVGGRDGKVLLVVFTHERIRKLKDVIMLEVMFRAAPNAIIPTAMPGPDGSLDWAYVYDRNKDGKIDYLAYLYSALPFKPDNFPPEYPKTKDGRLQFRPKDPYSMEYVQMLIRESRMVFSHHADDNFDGATDAAIASYHDSFRPMWIEEFGVLRSTRFDGKVDENWTFRHDIRKRTGNVPVSKGHFLLQNDQPPENRRTGEEWLGFGDRVMERINQFAAECGFGESDFRP